MSDVLVGLQITVLGMVSVFCILVILSLALAGMSRLLARLEPAPKPPPRPAGPSPEAPAAPERSGPAEDPEELIAVLSAAVAASKRLTGRRPGP